jgi:hypothetical protein
MKAKVGLHFFGRNHGRWAVWVYDTVNEATGSSTASKVANCFDYAEAVKTMYHLNGWGEPKSIRRQY